MPLGVHCRNSQDNNKKTKAYCDFAIPAYARRALMSKRFESFEDKYNLILDFGESLPNDGGCLKQPYLSLRLSYAS